ncbi:MAG: DNA primase [Halanaerobiales bacterium]
MSGNNENFVEKLKRSIDIVDVISDYVPLKKAGNSYKGLCPFHQEKTPSFFVDPDKQLYYCFGCSTGGDVLNFLMDLENTTFRETLKVLADRAGLVMPSDDTPYQKRRREERERVFEVNRLTARFYQYLLTREEVGKEAVDYLRERGFSDGDISKYRLGYAPDRWQALFNFLQKRGYSDEELLKAGVVSRGKNNDCYDRFRDRVIFPIFNIRGEVIAFGGRILDDNESAPKYLNSPETPVYQKGENLYGLNWARDEIRKTDSAVIMEGYTDVLTAQINGLGNAIASLGTAFTSEQARLLKRYATNIYISYDADAAGARATLRGLDVLDKEGLNVRVIQLPDKLDPDEFIKKEGKTGFKALEKDAVNLIEFKIKQIAKEYDYSRIDEKINFTRRLIKIIGDIEDDVKRDLHLQNTAEEYDIDIETLKNGIINYLKSRSNKKKDKNSGYRYTKKDTETKHNGNINNVERRLLKLYLDCPEIRNIVIRYLNPVFFTEVYRGLVKFINDNPDSDINELLEKAEQEKTEKMILSLGVSDDREIDKPDEIINKFIVKLKGDIFRKLQRNQDLNIDEVNRLFRYFVTLSA